MAGIAKSRLNPVTNLDRLFIFHRGKLWKTSLGFGGSIKRLNRMGAFSTFLFMPFKFVLGIFFLYVSRIQQDYLRYFRGGGRTVYPAFESFFNELRQ